MPSDRKPSLILPVAAAALLAGYVGAYYAMVRPETRTFQNWHGASLRVVAPCYPDSDEDGRGVAVRVFAPIHWLDRRIRPHTWGPMPTKAEWQAFHRAGLP